MRNPNFKLDHHIESIWNYFNDINCADNLLNKMQEIIDQMSSEKTNEKGIYCNEP